MTEQEKKKKREEIEEKKLFKRIDDIIDEYIYSNFENFNYKDIHETNLKYAYENGKNNFKKTFKGIFSANILLDIVTKNKMTFPLRGRTQCWNCGKYIQLIIDENHNIYSDTTECFTEKEFSFDINFPSGKILFCDWPHLGEDILKIKDYDVNYLIGRYMQSKSFAEKFVMHYYVGNTSPTVSQKGNEILVEYPGWNEDDEELRYGNGFEHKGNICTDLWWVTGIDLEFYKRLLVRKFGEDILNDKEVKDCIEDAVVLDVEPGTYKCTTFYETCNRDDRSKPQIFVKIEKN